MRARGRRASGRTRQIAIRHQRRPRVLASASVSAATRVPLVHYVTGLERPFQELPQLELAPPFCSEMLLHELHLLMAVAGNRGLMGTGAGAPQFHPPATVSLEPAGKSPPDPDGYVALNSSFVLDIKGGGLHYSEDGGRSWQQTARQGLPPHALVAAGGDWIEGPEGAWHNYGAANRMPAAGRNFSAFQSLECSFINSSGALPCPDINTSCPVSFTGLPVPVSCKQTSQFGGPVCPTRPKQQASELQRGKHSLPDSRDSSPHCGKQAQLPGLTDKIQAASKQTAARQAQPP